MQIRDRVVELRRVPARDLIPNPKNWRTHPASHADAMKGVLAEIGYAGAALARLDDDGGIVLLDGHLRRDIAEDAVVPVLITDLTEEEGDYLLATYDPLTMLAGKDVERLEALLGGVRSQDAAVLAMLAELRAPVVQTGQTDPDAVPPVPEEPTTRRGDLWLLGEHRLLCGDSTKMEYVDRLMGGGTASMLWTDPPYGVSYVGKTANRLEIANDAPEVLPALLRATFAACARVLAPGSPFYIARPAGALSIVFGVAIDGAGWQLHEELQWVKDTMVLGHSDYHLRHETIMYGWLPGLGRSGRGKHEGSRWFGSNAETSVFEIPRPKTSPDHPTSKPIELVERHVANSSQSGDIVLEPFSGSGSTLIACERVGRRCYAMEIEPRYVDVAVRRWQAFTGQEAHLAA